MGMGVRDNASPVPPDAVSYWIRPRHRSPGCARNVHVDAEHVVTRVAIGICPPMPGLPVEIVVGQGGSKEASLPRALRSSKLTPLLGRAAAERWPPPRPTRPSSSATARRRRALSIRTVARRAAPHSSLCVTVCVPQLPPSITPLDGFAAFHAHRVPLPLHGRCGLGRVRPPPHQPHPPDRGAACHPARPCGHAPRRHVGGVHDGAVDPQDFYAYQVRMHDTRRDRH